MIVGDGPAGFLPYCEALGAPVQLWVLELVFKGEQASLDPTPSREADTGLPPVPTDGWHVAWLSAGAGRSFMQS